MWFVYRKRLAEALRDHDWKWFAAVYNGPAYAKNQYHKKIAAAYERYRDAPASS